MAKTYLQDGNVIDYTNGGSSTIASGDMVRVGAVLGVALADITAGTTGSLMVRGVWTLPKVAATAVTAGAMLDYVSATADLDVGITPATGDLTLAAVAVAASAAGDTTVDAMLLPGNGTPA